MNIFRVNYGDLEVFPAKNFILGNSFAGVL